MPNNDRNKKFFLLHLVIFLALVWQGATLTGQGVKSSVNYFSKDSLLITADEYIVVDSLPYVLLIHEQGSSRGEFKNIIGRFQKMNFNCLVVDVRNGGNSNFVGNETFKRCRVKGLSMAPIAIQGDIESSVDFAFNKSGQKVILLGSGANGSLAIKTAKENDNVKAVIALSPGEFFLSSFSVEDTIAGLEKPLLITSGKMEFPYVQQLASKVAEEYKSIFAPENSEGGRGTDALLPGNSSEGEYWLAILLFFKDIK